MRIRTGDLGGLRFKVSGLGFRRGPQGLHALPLALQGKGA